MKVSELRELLAAQDPDTIVYVSSDEEGNSYNELEAWGEAFKTKQFGDIIDADSIKEYGYEPEEIERIMILYP